MNYDESKYSRTKIFTYFPIINIKSKDNCYSAYSKVKIRDLTNQASATYSHSFLRRQHISDMHAKEKICDFKQTYAPTFKT